MNSSRRFLFLQGNASRFFDRLGRALAQTGHEVHRVNFNGGDEAFWSLPGAGSFRDRPEQWPDFLARHLVDWRISDIVLFGDCRPLHRAAIDVARTRGIKVHVCDEGYLRPNWITLEEGGVNGNSTLPRDASWFRETARILPAWDGGVAVINKYSRRAADDLRYLIGTLMLSRRYPHYRTHRLHHPLVEYLGGALRLALRPLTKLRLHRDLRRIRMDAQPHYLFPLQLEDDSQIRFHSELRTMSAAIDLVIRSFAANAPAGSRLIISEHPLDNSLKNWRRVVRNCAQEYGVRDRVLFLERGTPESLLSHCCGLVTVNSTVGYLALAMGRPVVTLGYAVYDMAELTFQGGLDAFWNGATPPIAASLDGFRRVVAARTQINGGYFCANGLQLAVEGAVARLTAGRAIPATPLIEPADLAGRPQPQTVALPARSAAA